jgi:hypothetical protein
MSTSYFRQIPGKNKEEKKILLNRNVIGEKEASKHLHRADIQAKTAFNCNP